MTDFETRLRAEITRRLATPDPVGEIAALVASWRDIALHWQARWSSLATPVAVPLVEPATPERAA